MGSTLQHDLDPLDLEVLERALESAKDVIKTGSGVAEPESELELALRRELAEMVRTNGVGDPDALLDMLIEAMGKRNSEAQPQIHASSLALE